MRRLLFLAQILNANQPPAFAVCQGHPLAWFVLSQLLLCLRDVAVRPSIVKKMQLTLKLLNYGTFIRDRANLPKILSQKDHQDFLSHWFACYCVEVIQKNPTEVREHLNSATLDQSNVTKTAKYKKTLPLIFTHFLPLSMRLFQQIFLEFSPIFVSFSFSLK